MALGLSTQISLKTILKFRWLIFFCFLFNQVLNAQTVIIPSTNDNDTSDWKPLGCFNGYERTEALYTSQDISLSLGGNLTHVGFYVNALSNPAGSTPVIIRMKNTTGTSLTSAIYGADTVGTTLVYSGSVTSGMLGANSWVTIPLTVPFSYTGSSLVVLIETNYGDYGGEAYNAKLMRQLPTISNRCQFWEDNLTPPIDYGILTHKRPNIELTFEAACSGTPNPGNTLATEDTVCSNSPFTLSLQNIIVTPGLSYQWQSSPTGSGYNPIPGATNSTFTTSQTATTWYHCVVTCNVGGTATSTALKVVGKAFYYCYCSSAATDLIDTKIDSVQIGSISTGTGLYDCESYTDYTGLPAATLNPGQPSTIHIVNGSCSGYGDGSYLVVYIDYNHNAIFDSLELAYSYGPITTPHSIPDGTFFVPTTATSGVTGMRIVLREGDGFPIPCGAYTFGETEDYLVNIAAVTACTGTPAPGNTLSTETSICPNEPFTLSISNYPASTGITYQWQTSPNGSSSWTPISGATGPMLVDSQTVLTYYKCDVTCTGTGGGTGSSSTLLIDMNPWYACYCASAAKYDVDTKIDSVMVGTLFVGSPTEQCETYTDHTDLVTDLVVATPTTIHIRNGSCTGDFYEAYVAVYIDTNHSQTYEPGELMYSYGPTTAINSIPDGVINVSTGTMTGITGMRIVLAEGDSVPPPCGLYDWGETEDYTVNIVVVPPCITPPNAGDAVSTSNNLCGPSPVTLSLVGNTSGAGQTYQWEFSTDNTIWDPIPGAIGTTYIVTPTATTWYRCELTCSGNTDSSGSVQVVVTGSPVGNTQVDPIVVGALPYSTIGNNLSSNCWTSDYTGANAQASPDVFYLVNITEAGTLNVSTCGTTGVNTYIHLLDGAGSHLSSNDNNGPLCTGNDASDTLHVGSVPASFYVVVEGHDVVEGTYNLDITFTPDTPNQVNAIALSMAAWSLFPNPTDGDFTINLNVNKEVNEVATVKLYNTIGQVVETKKFPMVHGKINDEMEIPEWIAEGMYLLEVNAGDSKWNQRIVLQR